MTGINQFERNNEGMWARELDEERRRRVKARRQRAIRIQSAEQSKRSERARTGPGRIPAVCVCGRQAASCCWIVNTRRRHTNKGCGVRAGQGQYVELGRVVYVTSRPCWRGVQGDWPVRKQFSEINYLSSLHAVCFVINSLKVKQGVW